MNYIKYIKLNGEQEYKISDDGTTLLDRHMPSQGSDYWHTTTVSSRNKILSLRANYIGNNVECLLEDGKWYHIGSHGGLTLTVDELNKKHQEKKHKKETQFQKEEGKRSNWGVGSIIGGAGSMIGSAKKAIKEYQSIDDISGFEASVNQHFQDYLENQQKEWEKSRQRDEIINKRCERKDRELEKLRKKRDVILARERKKIIFSNLHFIFTETDSVTQDVICKYTGINDSERMNAVSSAVRAYMMSFKKLGPSEKFYQCWSEIFYLIEEGMLFPDEAAEYFNIMISKECGNKGSDKKNNLVGFDEFLKKCYADLEDAYWGYNFEKEPNEDEIEKRIDYLSTLFVSDDVAWNSYFNDNDDEDEDEDDEDEDDEEEDEDEGEDEERLAVESIDNKTKQNRETVAQKKNISDEKYMDLQSVGFEKEDSNADLLKPKNVFDLVTKGKNKQISYYKKKWNDSMWKLDHDLKGKVLREIIRIEEDSIKLVSYDDKLNALIKSGKSTGFWGFGASKEVNDVKSQMSRVKERISEHIDKLDDVLDKIEECEDNIKEYSEELYELTEKEKYNIFEPLDGQGISIARQLIKCKIDPLNLKSIFDL